MQRVLAAVVTVIGLNLALAAIAQERPADAPPLVEAKKEVVINWTMGDQAWIFKDISTSYEPIKGTYDPLTSVATWTLQLVRDFQPGEAEMHNRAMNTPFMPVLLDADKTVIAPDSLVSITPITGKMGDTIQLNVRLPNPQLLKQVKHIRVERRMNVGF